MTLARSHVLGLAGLSLALFAAAPRLASADDAARKDTPYTITVQAPAAKAGAAATAKVEIKPAAGYHMNKEYPTSLKLTPAAGVDLPKSTITVKDGGVKVEESAVTIEVPYTPKEAGKKSVSGVAKFAVCTATSCDPRKAEVSFTVDVK